MSHAGSTGLALAVCHCVLFAVCCRGAELYTVRDESIDLYKGNMVARTLPRGRIVRAADHPEHDGWCIVMLGEGYYSTRKWNLYSQNELSRYRLGRITDMGSRTFELTNRIEANERRLLDLYSAIIAVSFDSAVEYRVTMTTSYHLPVHGGVVVIPTDSLDMVSYRYVPKLISDRAQSLADTWLTEARELESETRRCRRQRRELIALREDEQIIAKQDKARFEAFRRSEKNYLVEPYITVRPETVLFREGHPRAELKKGTAVLGMPASEEEGWLKVVYRKGRFLADAGYFRSRSSIEREFPARQARLLQELKDCKAELEALQEREEWLDSLVLALTFESETGERFPITPAPLLNRLPGRHLYQCVPRPDGRCIEMINRIDATRKRDEWAEELTKIRKKKAGCQEQCAEVRQELAMILPEYRELLRKLAQAG